MLRIITWVIKLLLVGNIIFCLLIGSTGNGDFNREESVVMLYSSLMQSIVVLVYLVFSKQDHREKVNDLKKQIEIEELSKRLKELKG